MPTRHLITAADHGFPQYPAFTDITQAGDLETAVLARIVLQYGPHINSLMADYVGSMQPSVKRGGGGGPIAVEIILDRDEWITRIEGSLVSEAISELKFFSNKRKTWGPFGSVGHTPFVLDCVDDVPSRLASRMGILYFHGACDDSYFRQLGATFAEYLGNTQPPTVLKFEKHTGAKSSAQSAGILSRFARQLMSPIIILNIGPDNTEFRVHEDILCQLPFFRTALEKGPKEAPEKTVAMPDDEPAIIAALVEFLSTGSYTYTFEPQQTFEPQETIELVDTVDVPVGDVTQGSFHVAVSAVASKYDCEKLAHGSLRNFAFVLGQLKGLDVIRLWKAAYMKRVYISQFETNDELQGFLKGLPELVGKAYRTHREETDGILSESPALANDLLRLVTTGGSL